MVYSLSDARCERYERAVAHCWQQFAVAAKRACQYRDRESVMDVMRCIATLWPHIEFPIEEYDAKCANPPTPPLLESDGQLTLPF